jgi:hypothetical protein
MTASKRINRRKFFGSAAIASLTLTIVSWHVFGGQGFVAPVDKMKLTGGDKERL